MYRLPRVKAPEYIYHIIFRMSAGGLSKLCGEGFKLYSKDKVYEELFCEILGHKKIMKWLIEEEVAL